MLQNESNNIFRKNRKYLTKYIRTLDNHKNIITDGSLEYKKLKWSKTLIWRG